MRMWLLAAVVALAQSAAPSSPSAAVEGLLAADRRFSTAAATVDLVTGLTAMFDPDVVVPGPPATLHRGLAAATTLLRQSPDREARASWTPIRGGVSADGRHGFTFGVMTLTHADGRTVRQKYMAYWVLGPRGWRVAGYKRAPRPEGATPATMAPYLPGMLVAPTDDAAVIERHRASLVQAERAFSDEAQAVGLGPAFAKYGQPTAVNMGGPASAGFVVGAEAIATLVGAGRPPGPPSPVEWSSDIALVASSGDLGISFGIIRPNGPPPPGAPPGAPFLTIWSRPSSDAPWRYIAE